MEIEEIFKEIIDRHRSVELGDVEFKRLIAESPDTKALYKEWCHTQGYSERMGFVEYFNNLLDEEEGRYDALLDLDDQ